MARLGQFIPGFDDLTPEEKAELSAGLKQPENLSLIGESLPGFGEMQPDEQQELVGLLTEEEEAFQAKSKDQERLAGEMEQAKVEARGGMLDRLTQPLAAVPRGMANIASGIHETIGEGARATGRLLGIQTIEDYGKAFADRARTAKQAVNEAYATPLAEQSFGEAVMSGDVPSATLKVAEAGLGLVPFVATAQAIGPVAAMGVQSVPETIHTMEELTGEYDLGVAGAGAAVGGIESLIFGKLLGKLTGEKTPEILAKEAEVLTMDLLKRGTLSRIGAIIKDATVGGVKEAAKFAPAAAAVETIKYEVERVLQGQNPDMSAELKKRVIDAVVESIPMGLAAGAYGGASPRIRMGRRIGFHPDLAKAEAAAAGKPVAEAAPEWGPNEVNRETQPNLFRAVEEARKSLDKIVEIPKTAALDIAADAQADPPQPGQAVEIQIGGRSGFLVAPETSDPNAPVYFALGTKTGPRVAKVLRADGAVRGIVKAIAEGMISPEVKEVFDLIEAQYPELDIGTKIVVADHFLKLSEEFGADPSTYVGGRTDQPGPAKKTLISLFATDVLTRQVAGQDAIHEIYHHAFRNLDPSLQDGFLGWARSRGYDTEEEAAELYAQIGEAWHVGRLPAKDAPPSWLKQTWNETKAKVSMAYKLMAGIKGTTVPDNVAKLIGSKEIPSEAAEALDAPITGSVDRPAGPGYLQKEPSGSGAKSGETPRLTAPEPSYRPAGSETETAKSPGIQAQVVTKAPDGSVFSQTAPSSEALVPPNTEHSLRNIDEWKADALRWMKTNKVPDVEIMRKMASIDGQVKIMQSLVGKDGLEYFPEGAGGDSKVGWRVKGSEQKAGPIRGNQDPLYVVSFDLSASCVRRANYTATAKAIQDKLGRPLTDNQALALAAMFRESGEVAPCLYCYVEAPRRKMGEMLGKWIEVMDGKPFEAKKGSRSVVTSEDLVIVEEFRKRGLSGKDVDFDFFLDGKSLEDLDANHPFKQNEDFFKFIKKKVSAQVNVVKAYEEYSGQIMDFKPELVKYLKARAGLRFFSSSDFQPEHVTDLMQAIHDAEMVGLPAHAYSKIPELVDIFGKTGLKINTSLFSHGMGADGRPVPDEWQGMNWKQAFKYRKAHPDVGTVLVATSDDMIRWALSSPDIDFIIPFHSSGVSTQLTHSSGWSDYTRPGHEKIKVPLEWKRTKAGNLTCTRGDLSFTITEVVKRNKAGEDISKFQLETRRKDGSVETIEQDLSDEAITSGKKETVASAMKEADKILTTVRSNDYLDLAKGTPNDIAKQRYIEICDQRGITPVFPKFLDHPDYIKLKKDFARTDSPFNPVKADFNMKAAADVTRKFMDARSGSSPMANIYEGSPGMINQAMQKKFFSIFPKGTKGLGSEAKAILTRYHKALGTELGVKEYQTVGQKKQKQSPDHALRQIGQHAIDEARKLAAAKKVTAQDRVLARLSIKEQSDKPKSSWCSDWVDDLDGIRQAVQEMAGTQVIPADMNPETLVRLFRGAYGKADTFLRGGTFTFADPTRQGEPLQAILQDAHKAGGGLDEFRAYVAARRAYELWGRGLDSGINVNDAAQTMAQLAPKYSAMADRLYKFQDSILQYARDARVISQEQYDRMKAANQFYIPFARVQEPLPGQPAGPSAKSLELVTDPIKELKGNAQLRIVDPFESIVKNAYSLIVAADKNHVGRMLVDLAGRTGSTHLVQLDTTVRDTGRSRPGYLKVMTDGQIEHYRISPEIETAMKALDRETANTVVRMLAKPASWLRAGSVLTPEFAARNPVRDTWSAFINSRFGFVPGVDTFRGLVSVLRQDDLFWKWKASGGGGAELTSMDRSYLQESLDSIVAKNGGWASLGRVLTSPIEVMRTVSEMTEQMTRVGEFGAGVRQMGNSKAAMTEAAAGSRDVTLDFSRAGNIGRTMNMITAFWNANIQGMDKFARQHKADPIGTALRSAASLTLPAAILAYMNADDPRYQDLPQWQKDLFFIVIPDRISRTEWDALTPEQQVKKSQETIIRIPKPPGPNLVYTLPVERFIQWAEGADPKAFKDLGQRLFVDNLPGVIPTGLIPAFEGIANFSIFTRRPIEPAGSDRFLPEDRTTPGNTSIAKGLSRKLGELEDATGLPVRVSPPKLENAVRGLTGGIGMYALRGADAVATKVGEAAGMVPPSSPPAGSAADIPGIKGFVSRYPQPYGENVTRFLDGYAAASQRFNSGMKRTKAGDQSGIGLLTQPQSIKLEGIKQGLSDLMDAARAIEADPTMDRVAKKDQLDGIYLTMSKIAREGNLIMESLVAGRKKP
jgi:hypothetical protein